MIEKPEEAESEIECNTCPTAPEIKDLKECICEDPDLYWSGTDCVLQADCPCTDENGVE